MRRTITFTVITLATVAAAAAIWLWALRPLGFASYLSSTGASDADIIRQYWPHWFVRPVGISTTSGRLMNWHSAETSARLGVIAFAWLFAITVFLYGFVRHPRVRPNDAL